MGDPQGSKRPQIRGKGIAASNWATPVPPQPSGTPYDRSLVYSILGHVMGITNWAACVGGHACSMHVSPYQSHHALVGVGCGAPLRCILCTCR